MEHQKSRRYWVKCGSSAWFPTSGSEVDGTSERITRYSYIGPEYSNWDGGQKCCYFMYFSRMLFGTRLSTKGVWCAQS